MVLFEVRNSKGEIRVGLDRTYYVHCTRGQIEGGNVYCSMYMDVRGSICDGFGFTR